ncbi:helix-turn-helix transcriptional regulator [uncultured Enorma sp.]|uniref:helix-turn-helix transcriptional regulator n=1 Tax=uncultured Enorma sp. TaxID=1714346 RepID=UPI00265EAF49|nr:helix-turn-helix transcriptional regulator [uncultured Enorma sp.]
MTLQEKVGQYIEANETTMSAVAEALGISRSSLFNKLRGSNEFSLSEAFGLSRMLGLSLDELYRLTEAV